MKTLLNSIITFQNQSNMVAEHIDLISGIIGIITAIIAVYKYIQEKRKNKELEEEVRHIASTGVALGYYYNFAKDIFLILRLARLKVELYKEDGKEIDQIQEFKTKDVTLRVIMPRNLEQESIDEAINYMYSYPKADIVRLDNERNIGINYTLDENGKLIIIDFPKPLKAVRMHLLSEEEFKEIIAKGKFTNDEDIFDTPEWKKAEKDEMENFQTTIIKLIKRDDFGVPLNKIEFIPIQNMKNAM
ncbi:STING domain-containing protein [Flavivirga sp. 57AJ16]|uniref:STING domain-containing protein n=1 Tax=Flavivirga sp. 57AJ16 TaxID=3025307 RepID=UPI002366BBCF|nr:STING domain-containing protein [Flavivirga sp. 57AJ16]